MIRITHQILISTQFNAFGSPPSKNACALSTNNPLPSLSIDAGHSGHIARTSLSHTSSFSRNFRGLAYSALPSWLMRPKLPKSGTRSFHAP